MTNSERISFFCELICCNYRIYLWSYSPDLTLLHTTCPPANSSCEPVLLPDFASSLLEYIARGGSMPFILDTLPGLLYTATFEYRGSELAGIHIIGPAFTGRNSNPLLKRELDQREYSVRLRSLIFRQLEQIPIIPTDQLLQYAVMFHYCVTGEHIAVTDIEYSPEKEYSGPDELNLISEEHRGVWNAEQALMKMIREGNPDYKKALERSTLLSSGIKFDTGDSIRRQKSNLLTLLTLFSRAAIEGGLAPSVSYTLNDSYAAQIEDCKTTSALASLAQTIMDDYIRRVRQVRSDNGISPQIRAICDYINMHPKERFSISVFARQAGYTEYYFSHKFKQETGMSISEYIRKVKIGHACLLLAGTRMGIQEISDELGFSSRSYFSSSFQKQVGISPSEYRRKNLKM